MIPPYLFLSAVTNGDRDSSSPSIDHLARSIAAALARTLRAYLPVETRSVEARLDKLERDLGELERRLKKLGESVAHGYEDAS